MVRYAGSRGLPAAATAWRDAVFGLPLSFYLFDLPFYTVLRSYLLTLIVLSIVIYWIAARGWQLRYRLPELRNMQEIDPALFRLEGGLESRFLRGAAVVFLLALAFRFFLGATRWSGTTTASWWEWIMSIRSSPAPAVADDRRMSSRRPPGVGGAMDAGRHPGAGARDPVRGPALGAALYVKPNEISLERPYHSAPHSSDSQRLRTGEARQRNGVQRQARARIDVAQHKNTLENVRLWDWRAFHDTITQIQALRPYYGFPTAMSTATRSTANTARCWYRRASSISANCPTRRAAGSIPHFIYTHGYGLVLAEVSQITPTACPFS